MPHFLYPWQAEDGTVWVFTWDGGKQIKVALAARAPHDEIDVWDATTGRHIVPVTHEGMITAVKAWLGWLAKGLSGNTIAGRSATTRPPMPPGGRGGAGLGS